MFCVSRIYKIGFIVQNIINMSYKLNLIIFDILIVSPHTHTYYLICSVLLSRRESKSWDYFSNGERGTECISFTTTFICILLWVSFCFFLCYNSILYFNYICMQFHYRTFIQNLKWISDCFLVLEVLFIYY